MSLIVSLWFDILQKEKQQQQRKKLLEMHLIHKASLHTNTKLKFNPN